MSLPLARYGDMLIGERYILAPPYAFDQEHKGCFLEDDYPFIPSLNHILPRLKALVYFDDFRTGPRLVVSQPYLCICAGFKPGTEDVEGVMRLLSMVPGVLGETLIRPPWKVVVMESATSTFARARADYEAREVGNGDEEEEWEDVDDDDDLEDDLLLEDQDNPDGHSLAETGTYDISDPPAQYAPLHPVDLARTARTRLNDCFPYPLTIIEFASPRHARPDPDLLTAMFVDLLRLVMSLPQGTVAMMISVRGLLLEEVMGCVESVRSRRLSLA